MYHSHVLSPLAVCFLGLTAAGAILFWALPKASFSENEKRSLAAAPALSLSALEDGTFSSGVESYLSDHFPARLQLIGLNAYFGLLCGENGGTGVYVGRDGYLLGKPVTVDAANFGQNLQALSAFAKAQKLPAFLMAVPTAGFIDADKLPAVHASYPDASLLSQAQAATGPIRWVELSAALRNAAGSQQVFYRTDHHWTTAGAYAAYSAFCALKGFSAVAKTAFAVKQIQGFYGTTYSKSGLWLTVPDTLELWQNPALHVRVTIADDGCAAVTANSMYFPGQLAHEDKYPVFLDGNHSLVTIDNPAAPNRRLLLIKDSYADSLAPFLAAHYRRIDLVDLRYFRRQTVSSLVGKEKPDEILFVYGLDSLVNDRNLSLLS